jgi:hypothetical protein
MLDHGDPLLEGGVLLPLLLQDASFISGIPTAYLLLKALLLKAGDTGQFSIKEYNSNSKYLTHVLTSL